MYPFDLLILTLPVHSVTECVHLSTLWATHLVRGLWTTCRRRSSLSLMLQNLRCFRQRRSLISSLRPLSSQRWTGLTLLNPLNYLRAPLARQNSTTTAPPSPSPSPTPPTHRPVLSALRPLAPSVLPLRTPSAPTPTPPGHSGPTRHASSAGWSLATVPCPATTARYHLTAGIWSYCISHVLL